MTVAAGRSIEVVIGQRITVKSVGQPVADNVVEPLYAFDREVVPAGTRELGHVATLEHPSKMVRTRAILSRRSIFGAASPSEPADPHDRRAPSSILKARLATPMDSSKTPRGTAIRAVVTEPVFSADHRLIFPEGTVLEGEGAQTWATAGKAVPSERAAPVSLRATALRDVIETAEGYLRDHATQDRRVLLVITDGIDNASTTTAEAIQRAVERTETVIDAIGLFHAQDQGRAGEGGKELNDLTGRTGGVASFPESVDQIESVAVDLAHRIRSQYSLAYTPIGQALDGSYRTIRVTACGSERCTVKTRAGYRAVLQVQPKWPSRLN